MKQDISVEAHARYLVGPSTAAGIVIVLVLFVLSRIPSALTTLAFALLSVAVLGGLGVEVALWQARGVRRIELKGDTLTVVRGRLLEPLTIDRPSVKRIKIRSLIGLRMADLFLESGPRVHLSGQAFAEEEFTRFLEALAHW